MPIVRVLQRREDGGAQDLSMHLLWRRRLTDELVAPAVQQLSCTVEKSSTPADALSEIPTGSNPRRAAPRERCRTGGLPRAGFPGHSLRSTPRLNAHAGSRW